MAMIIGVDMANGSDRSAQIVINQDDMKMYGTYDEYKADKLSTTVGNDNPTPLTMNHLKALKDNLSATEVEAHNISKEPIQGHTEPRIGGIVESRKG